MGGALPGGHPICNRQAGEVHNAVGNQTYPAGLVLADCEVSCSRAIDGQVVGDDQLATRQNNSARHGKINFPACWRVGDGLSERAGTAVVEVGDRASQRLQVKLKAHSEKESPETEPKRVAPHNAPGDTLIPVREGFNTLFRHERLGSGRRKVHKELPPATLVFWLCA